MAQDIHILRHLALGVATDVDCGRLCERTKVVWHLDAILVAPGQVQSVCKDTANLKLRKSARETLKISHHSRAVVSAQTHEHNTGLHWHKYSTGVKGALWELVAWS